MGMVLTLYLISSNTYNSLEAPNARGFSYIEIWVLGTQLPILLALLEYGFILCYKKVNNKTTDVSHLMTFGNFEQESIDKRLRMLDFGTMIVCIVYFILFASFYWIGNSFD